MLSLDESKIKAALNEISQRFNKIKVLFPDNKYLEYMTKKEKEYIDEYTRTINDTDFHLTFNKQFAFLKDHRDEYKYLKDLILGWLVEDLFIYIFDENEIFKANGFKVIIDNHDKDRVIKKVKSKIFATPDFLVEKDGMSFRVEIQSMLVKYSKFHLKMNKAKKLQDTDSFLFMFFLEEADIYYLMPEDIEKEGKYVDKIGKFSSAKVKKDGYEFQRSTLPKNKFLKVSGDTFIVKMTIVLTMFYFRKILGEDFIYVKDFLKNEKKATSQYEVLGILKHRLFLFEYGQYLEQRKG